MRGCPRPKEFMTLRNECDNSQQGEPLNGLSPSGKDGALKSLAAIFGNNLLLISVMSALLVASPLPSTGFFFSHYTNIFKQIDI